MMLKQTHNVYFGGNKVACMDMIFMARKKSYDSVPRNAKPLWTV